MGDVLKKVPVREQDPKVRAANFDEVCLGYNQEEAMEEAARCLHCKNAKCVQGCPVNIDIPTFISEVKEGKFADAYQTISKSSALPRHLRTRMSPGDPVRGQVYPGHQGRRGFHRKAGAFCG